MIFVFSKLGAEDFWLAIFYECWYSAKSRSSWQNNGTFL